MKQIVIRAIELWAVRLILFVLSSLVAILIWMAFDPRPVFRSIYTHPVPVQAGAKSRSDLKDRYQLRAGDMLWKWDEFCWNRPVSGGLIRRWIELDERPDEAIYSFPLTSPATYRAGCFARTLGIMLPRDLPPGQYVLQTESDRQINSIATVTIKWKPVHFEIIK